MPFSHNDRLKFTRWFILLFYALALYKWLNGQWLYQMEPLFFNLRFDLTTWLFMRSGIHEWLLGNKTGWLLFDTAFYLAPLLWWRIWLQNEKAGLWMAMVWLIINWVYVQCYTLYPTNSIEGHLPWLLMPLLFACRKLPTFYYLMRGLRYFFLFFFASAGLWKLRQGGVFNPEQMSGILLMQHKEFLVSSPGSWFTQFYYWIIAHRPIGYALYLAGTLLELAFFVGFFTRRYDRWLIAAFVLFLLMDWVVMRISYFEVMPLMLPFLFSLRKAPNESPIQSLTSITT